MTRIFRIDGEAVRARLREWAHSLGQSDANVLGVVLFGSFARGGYTAASDADILVILQESPYRIDERIPLYRPRQLGVSADVFPYTLEEAKQSLRERWGLCPSRFRKARCCIAYALLCATCWGQVNPPRARFPDFPL
ncbi:MAG: nucleotidyltransferase domain-containing protein [Armatimonadota bacterium]